MSESQETPRSIRLISAVGLGATAVGWAAFTAHAEFVDHSLTTFDTGFRGAVAVGLAALAARDWRGFHKDS